VVVVTDRSASGVQKQQVMTLPAPAVPHVRPAAPSFREVYEAHVDLVWRTLRRVGVPAAHVDDVAQEVFLSIHKALPTWEGRASLRTWIYRIARNAAINHARSMHRRPDGTPTERADENATGRLDPEAEASRNESLDELSSLLQSMHESKREVLILVELEGFSVPEVAELTNAPLNTVYSRLRLARAELERLLAARGES
jgi:RNA polymerase sigma-70 factor, ECF subfamily